MDITNSFKNSVKSSNVCSFIQNDRSEDNQTGKHSIELIDMKKRNEKFSIKDFVYHPPDSARTAINSHDHSHY